MKYIMGLFIILSSTVKAEMTGSCTIGYEVFFFGTKLINSTFTDAYGTFEGIYACNVATDRCTQYKQKLDAPKFYRCLKPKKSGRFCQVKLVRKQDRVLGIKSWVYKTFKQVQINYGPGVGKIYSSKQKACQAAKIKCNTIKQMMGSGKCVAM